MCDNFKKEQLVESINTEWTAFIIFLPPIIPSPQFKTSFKNNQCKIAITFHYPRIAITLKKSSVNFTVVPKIQSKVHVFTARHKKIVSMNFKFFFCRLKAAPSKVIKKFINCK
jgi:hypothetical protein